MREHGTRGRRIKLLVHRRIHDRHHILNAGVARRKLLHDLPLAVFAMRDEGAHEGFWISDRGSVRRSVDFVVALKQQTERGHILLHIAIGRADDAGRPAHHVIAGEECLLVL